MNKTFKGLMADQTVERIRLSTNNGLTGYKMVKLQVFPEADNTIEATLKVFSTEQITTSNTTNFGDPTILAAAYFSMDSNTASYPEDLTVVIDNKIINQDIYVTLHCHNSSANLNYYIELEEIKLSKDEATVATLKDMRAGPDTNFGP